MAAMALLVGLSEHRGGKLTPVQYRSSQELGAGKLLVANPDLADPNFVETVVLIIQYDTDKGAAGLILNRQTKITLAKVFPELKGAKEDAVYEGGPVETAAAQALLRSNTKPEGASRVFGDVYSSGSKEVIEKSVSSGASSSSFRLYVGYGGWSAGQLEREVEVGGWSVLQGNADLVFDGNPHSLWQRLQHDTETRIAAVR